MSRDLNLDYWEPLEKARAERDEARRETGNLRHQIDDLRLSYHRREQERDEWRELAERAEAAARDTAENCTLCLGTGRALKSGYNCLQGEDCPACRRLRSVLAGREPAGALAREEPEKP